MSRPDIAQFALAWMDYAHELEAELERVQSFACAWAFDLGAAPPREVKCYWCAKHLGSDEDAIRAHVAVCRQAVKP